MLMLSGQGAVTPTMIQELHEKLGLDKPLGIQYLNFILNALQGDLGSSNRHKAPVQKVIMRQFPFTAVLAGSAMFVSILIGIPLGILSALNRGSWLDSIFMVIAMFGISVPLFWLGLTLILIFSFKLNLLPSICSEMNLKSLILPALTLGFTQAGLIARLTRSSMLETLRQDYVVTARSKGLKERVVVLRHALRNALIPVATVVGLQLGKLFAGAAVTETVFSRPGIGRLIVNAVIWKDYPLIQGAVLFSAIAFISVNFLVDVFYAWLDPRIQYT
jgi:ABC-type dipeptide/oligopeptide/nickel transport system permease component